MTVGFGGRFRVTEESSPFPSSGARFSELLRDLVRFRGVEAEDELLDLFGEERLSAMYEGTEPQIGEFFEILRILKVPPSMFDVFEKGASPEVELLVSEILRYSAQLEHRDRHSLVEALLKTLQRHAGKPEIGIALLRIISDANDG